MKMTIRRKLLLSYIAMAFLMVLASGYAISRLQDLSRLARHVVHEDFKVLEAAKKMSDILIALESAEKKFLILKDEAMAALFWERSAEFDEQLIILDRHGSRETAPLVTKLQTAKKGYDHVFRRETALIGQQHYDEASRLSSEEGRPYVETMTAHLQQIQKRVERTIDGRLNDINAESERARGVVTVLTAIGLGIGILVAVVMTVNIARPLRRLERATALVAEGHFDSRMDIQRDDEIGRLAAAFDAMTERLKVLEALRLDASPLTGLPGNRAIEEEIAKRLQEGTVFALCHVDLDNFKPFADNYGYAWASEVIKEVAVILAEVKGEQGDETVFIGHIGGDDFVVIAERAAALAKAIVTEFDRRVVQYYNEEDRLRGCITARDRQGRERTFPLLSITVSIVTGDGSRYQNPLEMAKQVAMVKNYAKTLPGSNYVTEEELNGAT
ncbi:MAG: HAMP domain-containing protein [Syntrophales bacterium]|nr:HAMP domain-containing protein [Syntrophales bacterium]